MEKIIYFDNAATTFPKPEVVYELMDKVYRSFGVNAGRSSYSLARKANQLIDETRKNLAELIGLREENRIIFSPSATIALNQIIGGIDWKYGETVYVTPFEHNAVMRPLNYIKKRYNLNIKIIPFNSDTFELDIDLLRMNFAKDCPNYIFMSHISNVTGYIIPIETIIQEAKKYGSIITLDCSQSMGLLPINVEKIEADYIVFAGHKTLYGPFGIAGFIDKSKIKLNTFITGGTGTESLNLDMPENYPIRYEAASQNIQAIAGLNASINWIKEIGIENIQQKEKLLTTKLINYLKEIYDIKLYLPHDLNKHIGIISFNYDNYRPDEIGQILDEEFNIAVRTGYHCAPLIHDFLNTKDKGGTVRISLSFFNTENHIKYLINCLEELY